MAKSTNTFSSFNPAKIHNLKNILKPQCPPPPPNILDYFCVCRRLKCGKLTDNDDDGENSSHDPSIQVILKKGSSFKLWGHRSSPFYLITSIIVDGVTAI